VSSQVDANGVTTGLVDYKDASGLFSFAIPPGTRILTPERTPLRSIQVYLVMDHPVVPDNQALISTPLQFGPTGAVFEPAIQISAAYSHSDIPDGYHDDDLALAMLDPASGTWTTLSGSIDPANSRVEGEAKHFSSFAVVTKPPAGPNWPLTAGILLVELGIGAAAFVYLRRRQLTTVSTEVFAPTVARESPPMDEHVYAETAAQEEATALWLPDALPPASVVGTAEPSLAEDTPHRPPGVLDEPNP
jgi:hypothetical protein